MYLQPHSSPHDRETARSYRILEKARQKAFNKDGYNSQVTHHRLTDRKHFDGGGEPRLWQLHVPEAIILGLDRILQGDEVRFTLSSIYRGSQFFQGSPV